MLASSIISKNLKYYMIFENNFKATYMPFMNDKFVNNKYKISIPIFVFISCVRMPRTAISIIKQVTRKTFVYLSSLFLSE